ncbi:WXG100 family type VII secretion target [Paenibacillus tundrae]
MTTIKVKPGQLLAISKQFEEAHYQVSQMTNRLKQRIVEIEQMWDGSTKENFYANFIYAQQAMDKFLDGSITISKELERHAEKFKNADNQTLETYGPPESNDAKAPAADTRNAFQKSADSIVELGQAFLQSADDRYQKRYDSVGGFLDYWTFGIPSGLVSGYVDRAEKAFNSPNDAANWITFGIHGTIREATFPTNAWSSEHWANIFGVGGLMLGGGYASSMMKPHNLFTGGGPKINPSTRPGTGNMTGGFNGFQDQRMRVTDNIAESKKARESSKFSEFVEKEKGSGKWAGEVKYFTEPEQMKPFIAPPKDGYDAFLERSYIDIRKVGLEDVPVVSKNTGLTVEQVTRMKEHLFLTIRDLSIDGKPYEKLYFQADPDIAYGWQQAQIRELNVQEKDWFKSLATHELKEKDIMRNGYIDKDGDKIDPLPLRDPVTWDGAQYSKNPEKNAHDAANELGAVQPTNNFPTYTDDMKYLDWDNNADKKIKY